MKKRILSLIIAIVIVISCVPTAFAERPIKVLVGGEKIATDVAPVAIDGRILVPVRAVFEALGAKVDYITAEKKVVAVKGDTTVEMVIDSNIMKINGKEKTLDVPATVVNNRTLVPLRACGEAFGHDVEWNGNTRTAKIKIPVAVESSSWDSYNGISEKKYDENGNLIYYGTSDGFWKKYTYDENGNLIYEEANYIRDNATLTEYTYNVLGDLVYTEQSDGYWDSKLYDDNGNCIDTINSRGEWSRSTYDANNNLVYEEWFNVDGTSWAKYTYDENNNQIYYEEDNGVWVKYTYDANGNIIFEEWSDGGKHKYTYDANNNLIYEEFGLGSWNKYTYDNKGRKVLVEHHVPGLDVFWEKFTYEENGLLTYYETSKGKWTKYIAVIR